MGRLGAHGRRQAEAHRAQPAAGKPAPRLAELVVLGRPHLVLAHAGGDDRVAVRRQPPQLADGVLRQDAVEIAGRSGTGRACFQAAILRMPLAQVVRRLRPPCSARASTYFRSLTIGRSGFLILLISEGSMSTWTILPCLANSRDLAGHAVVEPHAEGQQQVGVVDGVVGVDAAVHAEHVERQRIVAGEAAQAHQGHGHGNARLARPARAAPSLAPAAITPPPA